MTIDSYGFRNAFERCGRQNQFSHCGKLALFEHLESIEQDTGSDIELDVVGLCCEYTEYASALDAVYGSTDFECEDSLDEDFKESEALKYLQKKTQVIIFIGGVIIQNF